MIRLTKKYKVLDYIFSTLSVLANILPLVIFIVSAYVEADIVYEKLAMTSALFLAIALTAVSLIIKIQLRSRLWLLLIGLFICLDYALVAIIVLACCQIVDELVLCPLKKKFHNKYVINKELDKRL